MMSAFDARFAAWIAVAVILACYDVIVLAWLCMYGYAVSRAGHSRVGARVRRSVERLTGIVMIGLGARQAFERR